MGRGADKGLDSLDGLDDAGLVVHPLDGDKQFCPGFAGARFAHAAIGPHFAGAGWHRGPFIGRHAFFFRHHHFRRFAVFGAPFYYSNYYDDGCWRRNWTPYGWQWVNVCGDNWY